MKKIFTLLFVAALTLNSCDTLDPLGKYDLDKPESIANIKEKVGENVKADEAVASIMFSFNNSNDFTTKPFIISIATGSKDAIKKTTINLDTDDVKTDENATDYNYDFLPYSSYDFDKISTYLEEAKKLIPEEFNFKGIGTYKLSAEKDYIEHDFILQITDKEGSTEVKGRNIETTYYELKFTSDKDGTLSMKEN